MEEEKKLPPPPPPPSNKTGSIPPPPPPPSSKEANPANFQNASSEPSEEATTEQSQGGGIQAPFVSAGAKTASQGIFPAKKEEVNPQPTPKKGNIPMAIPPNKKDSLGNTIPELPNYEGYIKGSPTADKSQGGTRSPYDIRKNSVKLEGNNSPSTVLMESGGYDSKEYAYPTLFPKDPNNQTSDPKDWIRLEGVEAFKEAKKRGEVWEFDSPQEADKFARGSWKNKSQGGGTQAPFVSAGAKTASQGIFPRVIGKDSYKPTQKEIASAEKSLYDSAKSAVNDVIDYTERAATKAGVAKPTETKVKFTENKSDKDQFTEFSESVQDSHWRSGKDDLISIHRNQFSTDNGFTYKAVPSKGNTNAPETLEGVGAVAHFFIMDDRPEWAQDVYSATPENLKKQSNWYKKRSDFTKVPDEGFVPVFNKTDSETLNITYKKKSDLSENDNVVQGLKQYKASDINWDSEVDNGGLGGFKAGGGIKLLTTKGGEKISSMPFIKKDTYSRFSGSAPVILFEAANGKTYARDFSGSINSIKDEVNSISKKYNISKDNITLGFYDAGSFSAKPAGKDGKIDRSQWSGFNPKSFAGSGVAIPTQQIEPTQDPAQGGGIQAPFVEQKVPVGIAAPEAEKAYPTKFNWSDGTPSPTKVITGQQELQEKIDAPQEKRQTPAGIAAPNSKSVIDAEVDAIMDKPHGDMPKMQKIGGEDKPNTVADYGKYSYLGSQIDVLREQKSKMRHDITVFSIDENAIAKIDNKLIELSKEQSKLAEKLIAPEVKKAMELIAPNGKVNKDYIETTIYRHDVPNLTKIREEAENKINDPALREKYISDIKGAIEYNILVPQEKLKTRANEIFKKKYGSVIEDFVSEGEQKKFERVVSKYEQKINQVKSSYEVEITEKTNLYQTDVKKRLDNTLLTMQAEIRDIEFQAQNADETQLKVLQSRADRIVKNSNESIDDATNEIQDYNNKLNYQFNSALAEQSRRYNTALNAEIEGLSETYNKDIQEAYRTASGDIYRESINERSDRIDEFPVGTRFQTNALSALGSTLSALAVEFGGTGEYGERMEQYFQPDLDPIKKFSELVTNPDEFFEGGGSLLGGMIPTILTSITTAAITKDASLTTRTALVGMAGFISESADIAGRAQKEALAKTGSEEAARKARNESYDGQWKLLPLYGIGALKYVRAFKNIKNIPLRLITGGAVDTVDELFTEYPQNLMEISIKETGEYENFMDYSSWEKLEETGVALASVPLIGAVGNLNLNSEKKLDASAGIQYIPSMVFTKGAATTKAVITGMYNNGQIDKQTFHDLASQIEKVELTKNKGLKYSALSLERDFLIDAAENTTDEIETKVLKEKAKTIEDELVAIVKGGLQTFTEKKVGDIKVFTNTPAETTEQPAYNKPTMFTTTTPERFGTVNRQDGKGEVVLTEEEYNNEVSLFEQQTTEKTTTVEQYGDKQEVKSNQTASETTTEETTAEQRLENRTKKQEDLFGDEHKDKRLPYEAAEISDITTADKNGVTTATYVNPETKSVDAIITATNDNNFVGYVRVYENGKATNMFSAKMQTSESGVFKNIITSAEAKLPNDVEVVETTSISVGGLRSYNKSKVLVEKTNEAGEVVTRPTKYSDATKESVKERGQSAYNPFNTTDKAKAEAEVIKIKKAYPEISVEIIEKKALPRPPAPRGSTNKVTPSNKNYTISINLPVLVKSKPTQQTSEVEETEGDVKQKLDIKRGKDGFEGNFLNNYELIGEGSEHTVYRKKGSNKVIRLSEPYSDKSETTFNQRVRDAKLIDEIVGDGSLNVIGYYESENGTKNPIYEQNFQDSKPVSEQEVEAHLRSIGGIEYGDKYNRGYLFNHNGKWYKINDYSDNFFKDKNGKIVAIDAAIVPISDVEINKARKNDADFNKAVEQTSEVKENAELAALESTQQLANNNNNGKTTQAQEGTVRNTEAKEAQQDARTDGEQVSGTSRKDGGKETKAVPSSETSVTNKTIDELERQQNNLEGSGSESDRKLYNIIDKELEGREWGSVLNATLDEIPSVVDALMVKEKTMPNGYGSYMEKRDARETKDVANKYSSEVSKAEARKDFKDSFFGNPSTWYADGLKMRESVRAFTEMGGTFKELLGAVKKEFLSDGFSEKDAAEVVNKKLSEVQSRNQTQQPTPEAQAKATEYGYKTPKEAVSSVNKRLSTNYDTIEEIPAKELTQASDGRRREAIAEAVKSGDEKGVKTKINDFINELEKSGRITANKAASLLKQLNNTSLKGEKAVNKFLTSVEAAFEKSAIAEQRATTQRKVKAAGKKGKGKTTLGQTAKVFSKLNLTNVTDPNLLAEVEAMAVELSSSTPKVSTAEVNALIEKVRKTNVKQKEVKPLEERVKGNAKRRKDAKTPQQELMAEIERQELIAEYVNSEEELDLASVNELEEGTPIDFKDKNITSYDVAKKASGDVAKARRTIDSAEKEGTLSKEKADELRSGIEKAAAEYTKETEQVKKEQKVKYEKNKKQVKLPEELAQREAVKEFLRTAPVVDVAWYTKANNIIESINAGVIPYKEMSDVRAYSAYKSKQATQVANEIQKVDTDLSERQVAAQLGKKDSSQRERNILGLRDNVIWNNIYQPMVATAKKAQKLADKLAKPMMAVVKTPSIVRVRQRRIYADRLGKVGIVMHYLKEQADAGAGIMADGVEVGNRDIFGFWVGNEKAMDAAGMSEEVKKNFIKEQGLKTYQGVDRKRLKRLYYTLVDPKLGYVDVSKISPDILSKEERKVYEAARESLDMSEGYQEAANLTQGAEFPRRAMYFPTSRMGGDAKSSEAAPPKSYTTFSPRASAGKEKLTYSLDPSKGVFDFNVAKIVLDHATEVAMDYSYSLQQPVMNALLSSSVKQSGGNLVARAIKNDYNQSLNHAKFNQSSDFSRFSSLLLGARYAKTLYDFGRTIVEATASVTGAAVKAGSIHSITDIGSKTAWNTLYKIEEEFGIDIADFKDVELDRKSIREGMKEEVGIVKVGRYTMTVPEYISAMSLFMPTMKSKFKQLTGLKFDDNAFMKDPQYLEEYREEILEAVKIGQGLVERTQGSKVKVGTRRSVEYLPSGLGRLLKSDNAKFGMIDSDLWQAKLIGFFGGYVYREQGELFTSLKFIAKDAVKLKADGAEYRNAAGVIATSIVYSYGMDAYYALKEALLGDDDDDEAKERLAKLTDPKAILEDIGYQVAFLGLSKYGKVSRGLVVTSLSSLYYQTDDKEVKETIKGILKDQFFMRQPVDLANKYGMGMYVFEELLPATSYFVTNIALAGSDLKDITDDPDAMVAVSLAVNMSNLGLAMMAGTQLPMTPTLRMWIKKAKRDRDYAPAPPTSTYGEETYGEETYGEETYGEETLSSDSPY